MTIARRLARALDVLARASDIVRERPSDEGPPTWAERRGWTAALEALSDSELSACEEHGLPQALAGITIAPPSLIELVGEAAEVTALPALPTLAFDARARAPQRGVRPRKQAQLEALLRAIGPMAAHKKRIVDVGAGTGHFSRAASDELAKAVVGLDRDPARVRRAIELSADKQGAAFARLDAFSEGLPLGPDDLAVGLHACGELGDILAVAAGGARADVALVSCCLQKIRGPQRAPLSSAARARDASIPREILGLSNLTARAVGVERSLSETHKARECRLALRILLRERGARVEHGEELRGINRRRAHAGLVEIADRALALRGLAAATPSELDRAAEEARRRWAQMRRWSLPRATLARLLEVVVSLDRAALLEERGLSATVMTLVDTSVTARNIIVLGSLDASRLPSAGSGA